MRPPAVPPLPQLMVGAVVDAVVPVAAVAAPASGDELMRRGKSFAAGGITPPPLAPTMGMTAPPRFTLTGICEETIGRVQ